MSFLLLTNSASIRFFLPWKDEISSVTWQSNTRKSNSKLAPIMAFFVRNDGNYWIFDQTCRTDVDENQYQLLLYNKHVDESEYVGYHYYLHWEYWKRRIASHLAMASSRSLMACWATAACSCALCSFCLSSVFSCCSWTFCRRKTWTCLTAVWHQLYIYL